MKSTRANRDPERSAIVPKRAALAVTVILSEAKDLKRCKPIARFLALLGMTRVENHP